MSGSKSARRHGSAAFEFVDTLKMWLISLIKLLYIKYIIYLAIMARHLQKPNAALPRRRPP